MILPKPKGHCCVPARSCSLTLGTPWECQGQCKYHPSHLAFCGPQQGVAASSLGPHSAPSFRMCYLWLWYLPPGLQVPEGLRVSFINLWVQCLMHGLALGVHLSCRHLWLNERAPRLITGAPDLRWSVKPGHTSPLCCMRSI